jgi:hypothetical protein
VYVRLKTCQNKVRDIALAQLVVHIRVLETTASQIVNINSEHYLLSAFRLS